MGLPSVEFTEFVKKELGEEIYNELRREAKIRYIKVDLEDVIKKLKRMIEYKDEESKCLNSPVNVKIIKKGKYE